MDAGGRSEKHSTSPLKAQLLRTRMGSRLGSLWHHKEPSKGSTTSLDSTAGLPTSESGSTADQAKVWHSSAACRSSLQALWTGLGTVSWLEAWHAVLRAHACRSLLQPPDLLQFATPDSSISPHTSSRIDELQGHSSSEPGAATAEPGAQCRARGSSNSLQAADSGLQALDSGSQAASPAQATGSAVANGTSMPAVPPFDDSNQWSFPVGTAQPTCCSRQLFDAPETSPCSHAPSRCGHSQTQTSQGLRLAPVEAVRIDHGDGGTAWLNRWEEHNEGAPRRATDSSLHLAGRPGDVSTSGRDQEPRRYQLNQDAAVPALYRRRGPCVTIMP